MTAPADASAYPDQVPATFVDLVVVSTRPAASGVRSLHLERTSREDLPPWEPGAHVELLLPGGAVRHYSLCGDPADRRQWRISVREETAGRGGSRHLAQTVRVGDRLRARLPRNRFPFAVGEGLHLFVAGGIGITPLLPMVAACGAAAAHSSVLYVGSSAASMAHREELEAVAERVLACSTDAEGRPDVEEWLATELAHARGARPDVSAWVWACGPPGLLAAVGEACDRQALPAPTTEVFTPGSAADDGGGEEVAAFEVQTRSGRVLSVPAGESVLDVLERAGCRVLNSCRAGTCGTCETVVVSGVIEHRDEVLDDDEREASATMMVCVSRGLGRVVLDV